MPPLSSAQSLSVISKKIQAYMDSTSTGCVSVALCQGSSLSATLGFPDTTIDGSSVFGIGSVTKVFNGLLLGWLLKSSGNGGTLQLTDQVIGYLPSAVGSNPVLEQVELVNLATHSSCFPKAAACMAESSPFEGQQPGTGQIDWWKNWQNNGPASEGNNQCAGQPIGKCCFQYSDWANITLAFAVAQAYGKSYPTLLANAVTSPLAMTRTYCGATPPPGITPVPGYLHGDTKQAKGQPTDIKSCADDLLLFLQACLNTGANKVPVGLQAALQKAQSQQWTNAQCSNSGHKNYMGLGWGILPGAGSKPTTLRKNGAVSLGGYSSYVELVPSESLGVAILTNNYQPRPHNPTQLGAWIINYLMNPSSEASATDLAEIPTAEW